MTMKEKNKKREPNPRGCRMKSFDPRSGGKSFLQNTRRRAEPCQAMITNCFPAHPGIHACLDGRRNTTRSFWDKRTNAICCHHCSVGHNTQHNTQHNRERESARENRARKTSIFRQLLLHTPNNKKPRPLCWREKAPHRGPPFIKKENLHHQIIHST